MYFTSSNLLHDFPNNKYMFSSHKKKKNHAKNTGQPDLQPNLPEPVFNPLKMTRF